MRQDFIDRSCAVMSARDLDAIIAISPENFGSMAGFQVPTQALMRWRHAAAVVTRDGRPYLFCVDMEKTTVRTLAPDVPLTVWGEFTDDAMQVLATLLVDLGLDSGAIGIELDYLPARDLARLQTYLPLAKIVDFAGDFDQLRQIKGADEIERVGRASWIADEAIRLAFAAVRAGDSEMDLAGHLTANVYRLGADELKLMIVATGERSVFPNVGPTARILADGDVCRVELFTKVGGYLAGVCRTAVVGTASQDAERVYAKLVECKHWLLSAIKPGASSRELYSVFRAKLDELGLPPIGFVGHGIGLHLHEEPYIGPYGDIALEEGMVLGIEPLVYETGFGFGMQLKDIVVVTATGCRLLSDATDTDELSKIAV